MLEKPLDSGLLNAFGMFGYRGVMTFEYNFHENDFDKLSQGK
jgi:hypothetical protein